MKNQMGFTLINFSFLVPIVFAGMMLVVISFQLIAKYTDYQKTCRSSVMKTQQLLGQKLKELMDLNPQAKTLRAEEAFLKKSIATALATFPPAAIPFVKALEINLVRQGILRGRQELIQTTALIEARKTLGMYKLEFAMIRSAEAETSKPSLMIYKSPPTAIAPDHLPLPFFSELQTIKASWKVSIDELLPMKALEYFLMFNYPQFIEGKCSATLVQKGGVWNPKLHLAKF